jgi:hypothetical protein
MDNTLAKAILTKPFTPQAIYREALQHLIWMAGLKGAKQYAWQRAKQLEADPSGMYKGIAAELTKVMNENSGKS